MRVRLVLTVACLVGVALPMWASPVWADVDAVVNVTGDGIDIVAPPSADLGSGSPGTSVTALLGTVTVTDLRGVASASWEVTVTCTGFSTGGATPAETISAAAIDYWSGPATATEGEASFGPGQPTADDAVSLATEPVAFTQTGGHGGGSASWNPTLTVHFPMSAVAGGYAGTITHSVA